uniref:Uncharacterized protein n=1 Tax=Parascaris equorum TaxID=6256 RepID=A0A914RVU3_PAREQ
MVHLKRLSFREADSEATEKNEGQGAIKIVESHMEIQSSPEPEKHEEATKKTKEQGVIEVVNLESESDEEMTLGDIRSGIVAAKKEEQAFGKNNVKSDETPIQKPVESGSGKKKSVEKHRGDLNVFSAFFLFLKQKVKHKWAKIKLLLKVS